MCKCEEFGRFSDASRAQRRAMRAGYIAAGIALLVPAAVIDGAAFVNLAGGAVAARLTFLGKRQRAGELSGGGS